MNIFSLVMISKQRCLLVPHGSGNNVSTVVDCSDCLNGYLGSMGTSRLNRPCRYCAAIRLMSTFSSIEQYRGGYIRFGGAVIRRLRTNFSEALLPVTCLIFPPTAWLQCMNPWNLVTGGSHQRFRDPPLFFFKDKLGWIGPTLIGWQIKLVVVAFGRANGYVTSTLLTLFHRDIHFEYKAKPHFCRTIKILHILKSHSLFALFNVLHHNVMTGNAPLIEIFNTIFLSLLNFQYKHLA